MRRRKNSQQPNLKSVRVMVMGKDGVGKTGKPFCAILNCKHRKHYSKARNSVGS